MTHNIGAFHIILDKSKTNVTLQPINGDYSLRESPLEQNLEGRSDYTTTPIKLETTDDISNQEKPDLIKKSNNIVKKSRMKRKVKNIFDHVSKKNKC